MPEDVQEQVLPVLVAFRFSAEHTARLDALAAAEGLSRAAAARRAVLRDLARENGHG